LIFGKKTSAWVPLSKDLADVFDAYLITHELFLNNLGTRIKQSGGWFGNLQKWYFLGILSESHQRLEGLFACNKQGFASIHLACEQKEYFAKELSKTKVFQLAPVRMIMGESLSLKSIIPHIHRPLEITMDYAMLFRDKTKPLVQPVEVSGYTYKQSSLEDFAQLLPLQISYEKEEVVLPGHRIQINQTRQYLKESLHKQICVHGLLGNSIISKGMTNVQGRTLDQIGGVYTLPEYRNQGIGKHTMLHLLRLIHYLEKDASLFVKKYNIPAISLYTNIGFSRTGDFSIAYFM